MLMLVLKQKLKLALNPALTLVLMPRLMPMSMLKRGIEVMLMLRLRNEIVGTFVFDKRGG